jgi:hypothetical protein
VGHGRLDSLEFWTEGSIMDRRARYGVAWDSSGPCLHLRCLEHSTLNLHLDQVTASRQFDVVFLCRMDEGLREYILIELSAESPWDVCPYLSTAVVTAQLSPPNQLPLS